MIVYDIVSRKVLISTLIDKYKIWKILLRMLIKKKLYDRQMNTF